MWWEQKTRCSKIRRHQSPYPKRMDVFHLIAPLKSLTIAKEKFNILFLLIVAFYSYWISTRVLPAQLRSPNVVVAWFLLLCVFFWFSDKGTSRWFCWPRKEHCRGLTNPPSHVDCCLLFFISRPDSWRTFNCCYGLEGRRRAHPCRTRNKHVW